MSQTADNIRSELSDWCQSYVDAFNANDAGRISAHWVFPALIYNEDRRIVFGSNEHFSKNTVKLLSFYQRQGVERVQRRLESHFDLGASVVSIRVHDVMFSTASDLIVEWDAAYVLQSIDGDWRAVSAVADGELAAWRNRGTPLGS